MRRESWNVELGSSLGETQVPRLGYPLGINFSERNDSYEVNYVYVSRKICA